MDKPAVLFPHEEMLQLFAKAIESTLYGIMITDKDCNIVYVNPAFTRITGFDAEDVIGRNPRVLQSGKQDGEFYKQMWLSIVQTGQWQGEIWNRRKDGTMVSEMLNISALKDDTGKTASYAAVLFDITDRKKAEKRLLDVNAKLKQLSNTDVLTGLANRRCFVLMTLTAIKRGTIV